MNRRFTGVFALAAAVLLAGCSWSFTPTLQVSTAAGGLPPQPEGLQRLVAPVAGRLELQWRYPVETAARLTSQRVEIVSAAPGMLRDKETVWVSPSARSLLVDGLSPDRGYRFRVRAVNRWGMSPWTPWLATAARSDAPAAPGPVSVRLLPHPAGLSLSVSWRYPVSSPPLTSQRLRVSVGGRLVDELVLPADVRDWVYAVSAPPGVSLSLSVHGVNQVAAGPPSRPTTVTLPSAREPRRSASGSGRSGGSSR